MHHLLLKIFVVIVAAVLVWFLLSDYILLVKNKISDYLGPDVDRDGVELVAELDEILTQMKTAAIDVTKTAQSLKDSPEERVAFIDQFDDFINENTGLIEKSENIIKEIKGNTITYEDEKGRNYLCYPTEKVE